MSADLSLFALGSARGFGEQVARALGLALAPHEERDFDDGEHKARPLASVRGADVFVIQPLHGEPGRSVDEKLVRLLFFIGALVDASAARVTAVLPYLCYARKERKTQPRDPVTTSYVARMFEAVGCHRVVALDVHSLAAFQNAFRCRTDHLEANPLFVRHFAALLAGAEAAVVSPDAGGLKRAERFRATLARFLGREPTLAFLEKQRAGGMMRGGAMVGEVEGRQAIVLDDLISTGSTMVHAARTCRERGAAGVHAVATHGVFSANAEAVLSDPALDQVVVTNSVPPLRLSRTFAETRLAVLDVAPLLARAIDAIHGGGSITALLEP
jgi:ribose-phosphate pyrophosphokinase